MMTYPFTEEEMKAANLEWGCNCGPSALAFALQKPLSAARYAIPQFAERRYTSPTMMAAGLAALKQPYQSVKPPAYKPGQPVDVESMWDRVPALVRIQWGGPWTAPGANPKWAYRQTHWICTWKAGGSEKLGHGGGACLLFDCNGGIMHGETWINEIVPILTGPQVTPRANGEWFPTHIWRIVKGGN